MINNELIELLADYKHKRWTKWQNYLFSKDIKNKDENITISKELVDRGNKQTKTNYSCLSETEKNSDRNCTKEIIGILNSGVIDEKLFL